MLKQHYFVQFYWGPRPEAVEACARRIVRLIRNLSAIDSSLGSWDTLPTRGERRSVDVSSETVITELLSLGRNRRDSDGSIITELGFKIRLLSKGPLESVTRLESHLGGDTELIPNTLLLGPLDSTVWPELGVFSSMFNVARAVVEVMSPDFGIITSTEYENLIHDYRDPNFKVEPKKPRVGWITYIADRYWPLPDTVQCARCETVPGKGIFWIATEEQFDSSRPDHIERVETIRSSLFAKVRTKGFRSH